MSKLKHGQLRPRSVHGSRNRSSHIKYEEISKQLIKHMLGFEECDENFEETQSFILSNLLYHNCLDVNSHSVQDSIQGIAFKMGIHGNQAKAEYFLSLSDKFLNFLDKHEEVNLKWMLLLFLINLGKHPARDNLPSCSEELFRNSELDSSSAPSDEEWIRESMERSFHQTDKDDTLSNWSEDDEMRQSMNAAFESEDLFRSQTEPPGREFPEPPDSLVLKSSHLARSWIANTTLPPYWDTLKKRPKSLSEYAVMRECIWILISPNESFIFAKDETNKIKVKATSLEYLSKGSLEVMLNQVALSANRMRTINQWLRKISVAPANHQSGFGTLQSYSEGLSQWKHEFVAFLCSLEKTIIIQDGHQTLLWLLNQLDSYFLDLTTIHQIHEEILDSHNEDTVVVAFKLLSCLVETLSTLMLQSTKDTLLLLLRFALRFHLNALRNILFCPAHISALNAESLLFLREFGVKKVGCDSSELDFIVDETWFVGGVKGLSFLLAIQAQVAKACRLKFILGRLDKFDHKDDICIESLVSEALQIYYSSNDEASEKESTISDQLESRVVPVQVEYPDRFMKAAFEMDQPQVDNTNCRKMVRMGVSVDVGLEVVLTKCLHPLVSCRCHALGERLFRVLKEDFLIQDQMEVFRRIVVMEAGDIMHQFYSYFFQLIDDKEPISDCLLTNQMQDCVAVVYPDLAPNFHVTLAKPADASTKLTSDELFASISINYDSVFPVTLILKGPILKKYNQLFRFGLSLKRMICVMERLQFKDFSCFDDSPCDVIETEVVALPLLVHRLQLLRYWLLNFVRLIHDHFYSAVFLPFSDRFGGLFHKVEGFFQLIQEHESLINEVCHQCLFYNNSSFLKILNQIFLVVEEVRTLWRGPVSRITSKKLEALEDRYATGHRVTARFLSSCNNSLRHPHVAALAECLTNSIPE